MTPQEALDILTQATATINANREVHQKIIEALEVIAQATKDAGAKAALPA